MPPRPFARRISLVGVLALLLLLELATRRLLEPLLSITLLPSKSALRIAAHLVGLFLFNSVSVFGLLLAILGLLRLLLFRSVIPRGAKAAVGLLAAPFLLLTTIAIKRPLPALLDLYLATSFAGLVLLVALGGWLTRANRPGTRGVKFGLLTIVAPVLLHLAWAIATGTGRTQLGRLLLSVGEWSAVVAALAWPLCFGSRDRWRSPFVVGVVIAATLLGTADYDWEIAARLAAHGFGLELPMRLPGQFLYATAFGSAAATIVQQLARSGPSRLAGYGLALIALSGFQLELAYQLAATLVGVLCIAESLHRTEADPIPAPSVAQDFGTLVEHLTQAFGAQVETTRRFGHQTTHLRFTRSECPIELVLGQRSAGLQLSVSIGEAPTESAPIALVRRIPSGTASAHDNEVQTGDVAFDAVFRLHDTRRLTGRDPLLDDDMRPRLIALIDGTLEIWPTHAIAYRSRDVRAQSESDLVALVDLLDELFSRS